MVGLEQPRAADQQGSRAGQEKGGHRHGALHRLHAARQRDFGRLDGHPESIKTVTGGRSHITFDVAAEKVPDNQD